MADELLDHRYTEGAYQDPSLQNMSNIQRFLQENETCFPNRLVHDIKQPPFIGERLSPTAVGYYGAPNAWRPNISIAPGVYPQAAWSRDWPTSDHESCSVTTGNTWSPRASESGPDHDPRYTPWSEPHAYTGEYGYPHYGSSFAHGAGISSPQSITGALSEIQQYPDNEAEAASTKVEVVHVPYRGGPNDTTGLSTRTTNFPRDEGLGSSVNESAVASPVSRDDNVAMESVSGDGDGDGNYSDYTPQSRPKHTSKNQKARTKPRRKSSSSATAKRTSMSKANPHQLTTPAKVTKRTSSTSKPNVTTNPSTSPRTSQQPSQNINDSICSNCSSTFSSPSTLQKHVLSAHTRPFVCFFRRYGCTSRFGSKNEWKRHVSSQHLCKGIYRCDIGGCVPRPTKSSSSPSSLEEQAAEYSPNDFNRKDLFTQHLRRMHGPGTSASRAAKEAFDSTLDDIRRRCWIPLRDAPPKSICPYCAPHPSRPQSSSSTAPSSSDSVFEGPGSWDERMEHVGQHLEKEGDPGVEVEDLELRDWMIREELISWERGRWVVVGVGGRRRGRGGSVVKEEAEEKGGEMDGEGEADADGEDE
ncbi:MAG: hypothetical protein LQ338_007169 [Usnochroma carphineum]|nr:MAG: hypothetical protein LQ338_007169 [Usnochroma carphineum]